MPETFLADLTAKADAYEIAVRGRDVAKQDNSEAQALIEAPIAAGVAAVAQLDVVVANRLRNDPGILAKSMQARRIPPSKHEGLLAPAPADGTVSAPAATTTQVSPTAPTRKVPDDAAA